MKIINCLLFHCWMTSVMSQQISDSVPPPSRTTQTIEDVLDATSSVLSSEIFIYERPDSTWAPSDVFQHVDFVTALKVMSEVGVAEKFFYLGNDADDGYLYGLANIAAFLAQVMKESIRYNACDENNWDLFNGQYPIANSCGQLNQSYQDYNCPAGEEHMQCDVDPDMTITASTNAKWYGAPGPLYCGPKSLYPFVGRWDYLYECNRPWMNPPQLCTDYEDQKAGRELSVEPVANRNGRTDVEGCCWWGRGAIQSTGICNYGKLNYYLGRRAADEGRPGPYPEVDFCRNPDVICSDDNYPDLKWVAGMFYWIESVQGYNEGGWNYLTELHRFVDGGFSDSNFINSVSGIVNRGCHNPPCATGALDGGPERSQNFQKVLNILRADNPPQATFPVPVPIPAPVSQPSASPVTPPTLPNTNAPVTAPIAPVTNPIAPTDSPISQPVIVVAPVGPKFPVEPTIKMCCQPGETILKPVNGCQGFYNCVNGVVVGRSSTSCQEGLLFDQSIAACNWPDLVSVCDIDLCIVPTESPSVSPTGNSPAPAAAAADDVVGVGVGNINTVVEGEESSTVVAAGLDSGSMTMTSITWQFFIFLCSMVMILLF